MTGDNPVPATACKVSPRVMMQLGDALTRALLLRLEAEGVVEIPPDLLEQMS